MFGKKSSKHHNACRSNLGEYCYENYTMARICSRRLVFNSLNGPVCVFNKIIYFIRNTDDFHIFSRQGLLLTCRWFSFTFGRYSFVPHGRKKIHIPRTMYSVYR